MRYEVEEEEEKEERGRKHCDRLRMCGRRKIRIRTFLKKWGNAFSEESYIKPYGMSTVPYFFPINLQ